MHKWTYDISRHHLEDILTAMEKQGFAESDVGSRVLFCDSEGGCFFDDAPDPIEDAIKGIMNNRGQDGWELVQVIFREKEMLCFWRRQTE